MSTETRISTPARTAVRRLAVGRLISVTGGAAAYTALNFTIWDETHSAGMQALSLLLTFGVAGILGPFAGALGDRFDRRRVMVISEVIAAAFFAAMAFAGTPGLLIALAFGSAIAELPFFSASRAAIPTLVEREEDLSWANSLVTVGVHAGIALGPVIGGVLLGVLGDARWVFAINAVSFVVSVLVTLTVRGRFQGERVPGQDDGGLSAGLRFLWNDRVLRTMSLAWLVFLIGMGMGMVADAPLAESFDSGGMGFGLLIACWGTGSVLGSFAGRWMSARSEPLWLVGGAFGVAIASLGVGFAPLFPLVLAALLVMGTSDGLTIVAENGIMQRRTPDAVRSRTMAAFEAVLSVGLVVAYLLAGPVLNAVGPRVVYRIAGVAAFAAAIVLVPLLRLRAAADAEPASAEDVATAEPVPAAEVVLAPERVL
ncbi:MAG: MFS transporter [Actinomycetota bacterium]